MARQHHHTAPGRHRGCLDETDEIHGIPPLALPTLLDKNAESDGLGYWTVGSDPAMDFLDAVEHAFVRLSALPAFEGPAVSKLEVAKEKVKERAEVAKEEAKGNPAPVQEYATGSRVIISSDYYEKDLAGRHAVVTGFSTSMARITAIGHAPGSPRAMLFWPVLGTRLPLPPPRRTTSDRPQ